MELLNTSWSLYIHDIMSDDWSLDGYKKILTIESISEFHIMFNNLTEIINNKYYFIMRDDHLPLWEDENNSKGGCWSFRIIKKDVYNFCKELATYVIGETISNNPLNIIGISTSPKEKFTTIKLWTKTNDNKIILIDKSKNIDFTKAIYKPWI
jgi:hypothetical protein